MQARVSASTPVEEQPAVAETPAPAITPEAPVEAQGEVGQQPLGDVAEGIRGLIDVGGNLQKLTPELRRGLSAYYNRIPGLEEYVEGQIGKGSIFSHKGSKYWQEGMTEGSIDAVSAQKIKQMVGNAAASKAKEVGYTPPGQVENIDEFNKNLRKQQGRV
jgi:hypothetical protein